jgi:branched-subunit amino acid transport protein
MRKRLYQGFFAVTFFMMLLTLSLYLGMDFSRIAITYLGYVSFMGISALITSFVYVNTYYKGFKNGIIKSYLLSKEK